MKRLLVEAIRLACEADRAIDKLLTVLGAQRKFYGTKGQDRWVVERVFEGRCGGGYFVEIGAADGRTHSNTYALERSYGWTGIVVEANPKYIPPLRRNRRCSCIHACVDGETGQTDFFCFGFVGGIIGQDTDNAPGKRGALLEKHSGQVIRMQTTSLQDILKSMNAPPLIDYLSIDVEGAELRILTGFPFHQFKFEAITIERPTRAVHRLLKGADYVLDRVHRYDGFYVSQDRASKLAISEQPFEGMAPKFF
jgi:FkbM family methyltransferase